ncbi:MAG: hypothetical protein CMO07_01265 [Thalassospira sp.]|nr:hypothetical protein [Thalassospira sp.]
MRYHHLVVLRDNSKPNNGPNNREETMQGSDYDEGLVHHHEEGWHHWTKFMLWSVISIGVLLLLMAAFLID